MRRPFLRAVAVAAVAFGVALGAAALSRNSLILTAFSSSVSALPRSVAATVLRRTAGLFFLAGAGAGASPPPASGLGTRLGTLAGRLGLDPFPPSHRVAPVHRAVGPHDEHRDAAHRRRAYVPVAPTGAVSARDIPDRPRDARLRQCPSGRESRRNNEVYVQEVSQASLSSRRA